MCQSAPAEKRRRRGVSPVSSVCHLSRPDRLASSITRVSKQSRDFSPGFWVCLTVQNARLKPHTRASVSHSATTNTPRSNQETEGCHIDAHDEGLPRAWKSSRWSDSPTRAPRRAATPPRVPARRSRRRTSAHPPLAEFGRVARPGARRPRLRLGGRAVAAADPTEATRYTAATTPPSPRCAPRSNVTSPEPRTIFPAVNATANHHQKPPTRTKPPSHPAPAPPVPTGSTSARPRRAPAPERHLPHHPVRGARRREGDPGAGRARIDGAIVVAVALVRFVVRRRPARRQPGVPQGGIHRVPRGVRRPGRRGYRREGAQLRAINRRRSAKRRPRRVRPIDRRIRRQTRGGRHVQGLHRLRVRPLARVAVPPAGRAGVWRRVRPGRRTNRDDRAAKAAEEDSTLLEKAKEVCDEFSAMTMGAGCAGKNICRERARTRRATTSRARSARSRRRSSRLTKTGGAGSRRAHEQTRRRCEIAAENKAGARTATAKRLARWSPWSERSRA